MKTTYYVDHHGKVTRPYRSDEPLDFSDITFWPNAKTLVGNEAMSRIIEQQNKAVERITGAVPTDLRMAMTKRK